MANSGISYRNYNGSTHSKSSLNSYPSKSSSSSSSSFKSKASTPNSVSGPRRSSTGSVNGSPSSGGVKYDAGGIYLGLCAYMHNYIFNLAE